MAFTIQDYHDLARLLWEHPEWREELRRLLLSSDLLALPEIVKELAEALRKTEEQLNALAKAQQRTEERLDTLAEAQRRTEERLNALTEAQRRTEERLNALAEALRKTEERLYRLETTVQHLTEQVSALCVGQQRLTEQVSALTEGQQRLAEGQQRLTEQVSALTEGQQRLTEGQQRLTDTVGRMKGRLLEMSYREKAVAYFGPLLRRVKVVELSTIDDALDAALTPDEFHDLLQLDLVVSGKLRHVPESPDVLLAVEISSVVDRTDVSRSARRASLLRQAGYHAVPVVAGEEVTEGGESHALQLHVALLQDGQVTFWKEAVSAWSNIDLSGANY